MQHAVLAWLAANWLAVGCVAVYVALEWWLPRSRFKANSTVEAVANFVKATLLAKVPLVGWVAAKLGTPTAPMQTISVSLDGKGLAAPLARTKDQC